MKCHVYVGSYMGKSGSDGLYLLELDTQEKELKIIESYPEHSDNPSFLAVTESNLYAVSEKGSCGAITAFARDAATGKLSFLNRLQTEGSAMCHLTVWPDGQHLSAANYMSGSLLTASFEDNGSVGRCCDFVQHHGVGHDSVGRQEGPHVHSTVASPDGKRLYAADLGLDCVFCYETQEDAKLLLAKEEMHIHVPKGEGPRHFLFSQNSKFLYLVTEMGGKLLVYHDTGDHCYQCVQTVSTLPNDYDGKNLSADIHMSADGRHLYISNRGFDGITSFAVDAQTGMVTLIGYVDCCGNGPRNFCITPDDGFLLIANQRSGNVVLCERDRITGAVGDKLCEVRIPQAVYVTAVAQGA